MSGLSVTDPETAQKSRRPIHPYVGAKSDGQLLNKHAHVTLNVIAAAERKKRQSFFHQEEKDADAHGAHARRNNLVTEELPVT